MAERLPVAVWSGALKFGLDDGRRIIEEESLKAFVSWIEGDPAEQDVRAFASEYAAFVGGEGDPS